MSYDQTLSGISYKEIHEGSGEITIAEESSASRVLECAWSDRINLAKALYGYTQIIDNAFVITSATPHPDIVNLYPTQIDISPLGKSTAFNTYHAARLAVKYSALNFKPDSQDPTDLQEERLRTSYEIMLIPRETQSGNGEFYAIDPIQVVIPKVEYDLTIHRVPELPFTKVATFMGVDGRPKVNSTTFKGATAGHMLFLGVDADRKTTSFGVQSWDVTYHFLWSHIDHRKAFNPKTGVWENTNHKVTGNAIYDTGDFNDLLY